MRTLWLLAKRTVQQYSADNCSYMAAAISYYVLFSIIPLAIFTVSVFGMVVRSDDLQQRVANRIVDALSFEPGDAIIQTKDSAIVDRYGPSALAEVSAYLDSAQFTKEDARAVDEALRHDRPVELVGVTLSKHELSARNDNVVTQTLDSVSSASGALTVIGLIGMAWSASAMFGAIRKSLNIAWDTDVSRPVVQQKLVDLAMVLALGILFAASIAGTAALRVIREMSSDKLGPLSHGTGFFWSVLPLFLPAVFSFSVFLLLYRYVPRAETRFGDIWPGALLATVLFELLKNAFALYVAKFNNFDVAYGTLGGVLLFMLWTYLTANILLIGAELATEYPRLRRGEYAQALSEPGGSVIGGLLGFVRGLFFHQRTKPEKQASHERAKLDG